MHHCCWVNKVLPRVGRSRRRRVLYTFPVQLSKTGCPQLVEIVLPGECVVRTHRKERKECFQEQSTGSNTKKATHDFSDDTLNVCFPTSIQSRPLLSDRKSTRLNSSH